MKIDQVNIHRVCIPFSQEFSHSLRKGPSAASAHNVIVEVVAGRGEIKGYGEAAPRSFVTGESQESVTRDIGHFLEMDSFPWELSEVEQVWHFVDSLPEAREHHSAICALETSLLDALGKEQNKPVVEYFPQDFFHTPVHYGANIPMADEQRVMGICQLMKKMKIKKLKLKMGKDFTKNKQTFEAVGSILGGDDYDLRIDVNGAWDRELAFKHISLVKEHRVKVIEQPMMPHDENVSEFAGTMKDHGVFLMADESACSLTDVLRLIEKGDYRLVNVRLSKCGGFRNALRIIDRIRASGLSFQIGCHLGESGVLSAAGRVLSLLCRDAVYHDGSYDQFLLRENITSENVSFGARGEAGPLAGPGLGVEVAGQSLKRLSTDSAVFMNRKH